MNADRLLEHFERISDAADAVPRLRRFVLDLAVRGKLVAQDATNETADSILELVSDLGPTRQARGVKASVDSDSTGINAHRPHALPSTWKWVTLGDLFNYDAGIKREPRQLDLDLWLLELEDIEKDTSRIITRLKVRERDSQSTKSEFLPGDILYGKLRPYLNKVVVADQPGYSTTEIVAIRPKVPMNAEYCRVALQRPDFVRYVERLGRGTKMPRLRTPDALAAPFPLPPLAEQHRIVAKVDELMLLCDRLAATQAEREARRDHLVSASLARTTEANDTAATSPTTSARFHLDHFARLTTRSEHVKQLRKVILNLAVRGRLVPQDPAEAPASEILASIAMQKNALVRDKAIARRPQIDPPPVSEGGFSVPSGWEWCRLEHVILTVGDGPHFSPQYVDPLSGVPFLSARNITANGFQLTDIKFVSKSDHREFSRKLQAVKGDVLYTKGGTTGVAVVNTLTFEFSVWVHVAILKVPTDDICSEFLALALNSPHCYEQSQRLTHGIGNRDLGLTRMILITIPLPPLAEQRRIVAKVNELMGLCDQLEDSLNLAAKDRAGLLEALLDEALEPVA